MQLARVHNNVIYRYYQELETIVYLYSQLIALYAILGEITLSFIYIVLWNVD